MCKYDIDPEKHSRLIHSIAHWMGKYTKAHQTFKKKKGQRQHTHTIQFHHWNQMNNPNWMAFCDLFVNDIHDWAIYTSLQLSTQLDSYWNSK